jgi:anthranilate synthase component 1
MITPSCEQIESYAKDYSVVPVCREIYADIITPISLLRKLSAVSSRYYLLESVEGGEKWGRYSFLGYDPILRATCDNGAVTVEQDGTARTVKTAKPLDVVREILARYKAPKIEGLPPFTGGFVGYFAYAMLAYAEPTLSIKRGEFHDFDLMLFDRVIAYDHLKQKICIIVNMKTDRLMENYGRAMAELETMAALIRSPELPAVPKVDLTSDFQCNVSKEEYASMVERTREYIRGGDIFQAVISRRFSAGFRGSLINAYRVLRTSNPSPYMVFLKADGAELICSSPETLVRLKDGRLTTFPVAGSRPRGATDEEDKALEADLLQDEKELSEHNMLVDLGRNDLGRISEFNSVTVTEYMMIHRYSKIMHICSQVESDIRAGEDGCSAIEAVLPAGTLSGAPKIRACQIIDELESEPRGVYGGALGYLDFTGNMDTCIAIRMAVAQNGRVDVQAGGGIVADSVPDNEYAESANKAAAVMNAIRSAGEVEL